MLLQTPALKYMVYFPSSSAFPECWFHRQPGYSISVLCVSHTWLIGHVQLQVGITDSSSSAVYVIYFSETGCCGYMRYLSLFDTFFFFFLSQIAFLFTHCHCFVYVLINLFPFSGFRAHYSSLFSTERDCYWPEALTWIYMFDIISVDAFELMWYREATLQPCKMMYGEVQVEIHLVFLNEKNRLCSGTKTERRC